MCWSGPVVENVSQVRVTLRAEHLRSFHEEARVRLGAHVFVGDRLRKARPTRAGIELGVGIEQRRATADASVCAWVLGVVVLTGEGALRPFLSRDTVLLRRALLTPLPVSLLL